MSENGFASRPRPFHGVLTRHTYSYAGLIMQSEVLG